MPELSNDPIEEAEYISTLGLDPWDLDNPTKLRQINNIIAYFKNRVDGKYVMAKVLSGKPGEDRLNVLWSWVQLQEQRTALINKLMSEQFEDDIHAEVQEGYISKDSIERVKQDISERESQGENFGALKKNLEGIEQVTSEIEVYG